MKNPIILLSPLLLLLFLLPLKLQADEPSWKVGLIGEYGFGESSYELRVDDGTESVRSLLVFPLDTLYLGLEAEHENTSRSRRYAVKLLTNVAAPGGRMTDEDWLDLLDPAEPEFIFTESNLDYRSLDLALEGIWEIGDYRFFRLFFGAGYRFLWIHQLITDYQGFRLHDDDENGSIDRKEIIPYTDKDAIDYSIIYHIIDAGLHGETDLGRHSRVGISAAPSLGMAFDRDDHLLRSKLSTGRGFGYGFVLRGNIEFRRPGTGRTITPYLRIYGSYRWFFSPGVQRQYWYDDADKPEGTEYNGLVHDMELIDPRMGISAGLRF
ncbi:hypothetical protein [Marispirochaeta aestuarii]|uniref:hypothetical protein n=1 Tax=Marispirochaeta aestuarii TaxID=1963862 RepID=UPI002ABDC85D|nr:hypothetical protein [Marispirochaeta aestuarii]